MSSTHIHPQLLTSPNQSTGDYDGSINSSRQSGSHSGAYFRKPPLPAHRTTNNLCQCGRLCACWYPHPARVLLQTCTFQRAYKASRTNQLTVLRSLWCICSEYSSIVDAISYIHVCSLFYTIFICTLCHTNVNVTWSNIICYSEYSDLIGPWAVSIFRRYLVSVSTVHAPGLWPL